MIYTESNTGEPIQKTRYKLLGYAQTGNKPYTIWRIIDRQTGHPIGPMYLYRCELLADLDRVAGLYGY